MTDENPFSVGLARCRRCRFWLKKETEFHDSSLRKTGSISHGECHRAAPLITGSDSFAAQFPSTMPDDWCGEWMPAPAAKPSA